MKKSLLFIFAIIFLASLNTNAQCTGCTTNITGLSALNYLVTSGQKLCISSTGTVTGLISVSGGTLCNQGTINTSKVQVINGGSYTNYGYTKIDSLLIYQTGSKYVNNGTAIHVRFATKENAQSDNNGTTTCDYIGDSISTINNNGNMTINFDFYNAYSSNFNNNSYLKVNGTFYNGPGGAFYTNCKVNVLGSWYNSALVKGPISGCGGFNITGTSANSGTVGLSGQKIDICDAGSPTSLDANSGVITNATFCLCTNSCVMVVGILENKTLSLNKNFYPNPCTQKCVTEYEETIKTVNVFNQLGQIVKATVNINDTKVELSTSGLAAGIYFVESLSVSGKIDRQKLVVE